MFLMLTKHPFYSFSYLTPYNYVFCRNEDNEAKSKKYGQKMRKLCMEEAIVVTKAIYSHDYKSKLKTNNVAKIQCGYNHRTRSLAKS